MDKKRKNFKRRYIYMFAKRTFQERNLILINGVRESFVHSTKIDAKNINQII